VATAVYSAFGGIIILLAGLIMLFAGQVPDGNTFFTLGGIFSTAFGVLLLTAVYGLWSIQDWGRKLAFWLYAVSVPLGIASIFPIWPGQEVTTANTVLQLVGIAVDIVILAYLSKLSIKDLYSVN
jgi:uncharacterized membrane protein (DUF2068 family)